MDLTGQSELPEWIFECDFLQPFFFKESGNSFNHSTPYFKVNRQVGILMGNIYPGADNKMDFITFHKESYNFISGTLAQFNAVIV